MSEELVKKDKHPNRHENFKGKIGRPKGVSALTPMSKTFLEGVYIEGLPYNLAYKNAGYKAPYSLNRANDIINTPASQEYIKNLESDENLKLHATKSFLIKNLVDRLNNAKDSDAVAICRQISQMLGYSAPDNEIKVDNKIEIIWTPLINFDIKENNSEQ